MEWDLNDIPDYLQVISWKIDGANGPLHIITSDENMKLESELKVVCCKHSASRTAIEQAANTGPIFKLMKHLFKSLTAHMLPITICLFSSRMIWMN